MLWLRKISGTGGTAMKTEKITLKLELQLLESMVNQHFKNLSGIDAEAVPEKYGDTVVRAKETIRDNLNIVILYKCDNIKSMSDDEVVLENGLKYSGKMPVKILKDAAQVVTCVITLQGFQELAQKEEDFLVQYFMDTWGSAYVESAQAYLGKKVLEDLKTEGKSRTHLWSPGQYGFELKNQKTIFELLNPEEVGCTLTKKFMMVPVKSGSGIWGVIEPDVKDLLLPCDFCQFGSKCPASKRGCAQL